MVSSNGYDAPRCLHNSSGYQCRTPSFALQHKKQIICLLGRYDGLTDYITLAFFMSPVIISGNNGSAFIYCTLYFVSNPSDMTTIILNSITFRFSRIYVRNVNLIFKDCTLLHTKVKEEPGNFVMNNVQISLIACDLTGTFGGKVTFTQIDPSSKISLKLIILECLIMSYRFFVEVSELVLIISNTMIREPYLNVRNLPFLKTLSFIYVENSIFDIPIMPDSIFNVRLGHIHRSDLYFYNCTFNTVPLILKAWRPYNNDVTNTFVTITHSVFKNVVKTLKQEGIGGGAIGLMITSHNIVTLILYQCTFVDNVATASPGGAVFVDVIQEGGTTSSISHIRMFSCTFKNNLSPELGTAIYVAKGTKTQLISCSFQHNISPQDQEILPMVAIEGETIHFEANFQLSFDSPGSLKLVTSIKVIDIASVIGDGYVKINVLCPLWYQHANRPKYKLMQWGSLALDRITYDCVPCSEGLYIGQQEAQNFTFGYSQKDLVDTDKEICKKCPYGGHCTGIEVVPRPNYWGYWHNNKLMFQQCPPGYCCSGDTNEPCFFYDYCKGNRTGTLCGKCQNGFSLSILKGVCTHDSECGGNHWFWFMALSATFVYAIWYTFKDDMFKLVTLCLKRIKTRKIIRGKGKNEYVNEKPTNKGYFGIISNYIQLSVVITIHIEFDDIDKSKSVLDTLSENVGRFFGIELSNFSLDICPMLSVTTLWKNVFRFGFLYGIYMSWLLIYLCGKLLFSWVRRNKIMIYSSKKVTSFESKMLQGIVEIIKYTYTGICEIVFISLTCVRIRDNYVWWYDASNTCIEIWQIVFIVFAVWFILPFPPALFLGMKLLTQQIIGPKVFIAYCLCPLLGLIIHLLRLHKLSQPKNEKSLTPETSEILSILQGPYRHSDKYPTLYWEAMISLRRLFIAAMTLIGYASIRMMFIVCLCIAFSFQHLFLLPFRVRTSNHIEAISLGFLTVSAVINLLKATLTDSGVIPSGPSSDFFKSLQFIEKLLLSFLLLFILLVEGKAMRKSKQRTDDS